MDQFYAVFSEAQQFLILQGYADQILSEEEMMTFLMQEASDKKVVFLTEKGLYLVVPALSLDDFTHDFYPQSQLQATLHENQIDIEVSGDSIILPFAHKEDADSAYEDLLYLWREK